MRRLDAMIASARSAAADTVESLTAVVRLRRMLLKVDAEGRAAIENATMDESELETLRTLVQQCPNSDSLDAGSMPDALSWSASPSPAAHTVNESSSRVERRPGGVAVTSWLRKIHQHQGQDGDLVQTTHAMRLNLTETVDDKVVVTDWSDNATVPP